MAFLIGGRPFLICNSFWGKSVRHKVFLAHPGRVVKPILNDFRPPTCLGPSPPSIKKWDPGDVVGKGK